MNRIFRGFCINRFGIGTLHYISSCSDFGLEFSEIFVLEKRLPDSMIRGVGDSPCQWYVEWVGESPTQRYGGVDDSPHHRYGESAIEFFKRKFAVSWYGKSSAPLISDAESRLESESCRLPVLLSRGVDVSNTRSHYLKKTISLASIFSTLNGWSMLLKDRFGQKKFRIWISPRFEAKIVMARNVV